MDSSGRLVGDGSVGDPSGVGNNTEFSVCDSGDRHCGCLARYWSLSSATMRRRPLLSSTRLSFLFQSCIICLLTVMSSSRTFELSISRILFSDELRIGDDARKLSFPTFIDGKEIIELAEEFVQLKSL